MSKRKKSGLFKKNLLLEARRHLTLSREVNDDLEGTGKSPIIMWDNTFELDDFYHLLSRFDQDAEFGTNFDPDKFDFRTEYMFADEKPFSEKWMEKRLRTIRIKVEQELPLNKNDMFLIEMMIQAGFEIYTDGTFKLKGIL